MESLCLLYFEPEKILGPFGPGSSTMPTVFSFLKMLFGFGRFGMLGVW
jgi:hypothetical protein